MKRINALATSIALLAAVPATARADILWDLVHAAGSGGDYGTSKVLNAANQIGLVCGASNSLTCGTITASSQTDVHVYGNDYDNGGNNGGSGALGAYNMAGVPEKGLGMCFAGSGTNGCDLASPPFHEVDIAPATGPLYLDLSLVANSGALNHLWLASVQAGEGYEVYGSLAGTGPTTGTTYVLICSGSAPTIGDDIADCAVGANYKFLRFHSVTNGDFSVQALRFSSVVPEPGTMVLLATGLVALTGAGFVRRRNKKS
jgi:PEP-CTERM motif-containing protein